MRWVVSRTLTNSSLAHVAEFEHGHNIGSIVAASRFLEGK
jgi:hypothetical protein